MSTRAPNLAALAALCALPLVGCTSYLPRPLDREPVFSSSIAKLPEGPGASLTINDLDRLTLANNPELRAARARLGIATAQTIEASTLPNPQVTLSFPFVIGGPDGVNAFNAGVSQDLKAVILRPAKTEAAANAAAEVNASLLWQEWQTVGKARLLFVGIVSGERDLKLIRRNRELLQERLDHATAAVNQGNGSIATLSPDLTAAAEIQKLHDDLERLQLSRRHQLNSLLGLDPDALLLLSGASRPPLLDIEHVRQTLDGFVSRRPDLIALQFGYESQDAKFRQAILSQFPSISIGIAGGRETDAVRTFGPHITFDVPIFDRGEGAVARESATREALHAEFQARLSAASSEIKGLLSEQSLLQHQLATLEPRLRKAKAIAIQSETAFQKNLLDERTYVDTQVARLSMERQQIELEQALLEGRTSLATLSGVGLPQVSISPEVSLDAMAGGLREHPGRREAARE